MVKFTPKEARKLWIKTLRKGAFPDGTKFKQAIGELRDGDAFCCLGVACELYRQMVTPSKKWTKKGAFLESAIVLPRKVINWLGLFGREGQFNEGSQECLSGLNDNGKSFKEIASVIAREPRGLVEEARSDG